LLDVGSKPIQYFGELYYISEYIMDLHDPLLEDALSSPPAAYPYLIGDTRDLGGVYGLYA
jgi:hypothetical protein